jgi:hypothetical protein
MNKSLIVFPGAGNPSAPLYKDVYKLIERGAIDYGYDHVDLSVRYPGQFDDEHNEMQSSLSFISATEVAIEHLRQYEKARNPFDILGRSFGTFVALKSAEILRPEFLERMILWGAPAYWRLWSAFVQDFAETQRISKDKKVLIEENFFVSIQPIESLLPDTAYSCKMVSGSLDKNTTAEDMNYYRQLANENVRFSEIVKNAKHEVTNNDSPDVIAQYLKVLFTE